MKYNDFFEYEETVKKALDSDKLAEYIEKFNIPKKDAIMYLALSSYVASSYTRRVTNGMLRKGLPVNSACNRISTTLSQYIFDKVDYFKDTLDFYNAQFSAFNDPSGECKNPYLITQKQYQDYLLDTTEEPQEDIEEYLKVMSLSNKASKILTVFKDYNTNQALDIATKINKKNYRNKNPKRFSTNKGDYIQTFNSISSLSNQPQENGTSLKIDFLNTYLKYIKKEISEEELKSSEAYNNMVKLFSDNNPHNCYMHPVALYKNLSLEYSIDTLYLTKNLYFKKAFREFAELSKTKKSYRYRVTKSHDDNISEAFSGNCYSTNIHFAIAGYNAPFSIHQDPNVVSDLENKYGISIEEGKISPPFTAAVPYKYTSSQRKEIGRLHMNKIKKLHPYSRKFKISEFSNNMQFYIKGLQAQNIKKAEDFELTQPQEIKTTPNNIEDDNDEPII